MANVAAFHPGDLVVPAAPPGPALKSGDHGPDVSAYQPGVDWAQVAGAGYRFAFVKATESVDYLNPLFADYWQQAQAHGLVRGAYHFARPDTSGAAAEVFWFTSQVEFGPDDIAVLDLEVGSGDLKAWAISFAAGLPAIKMLYSGIPFMQAHNLDNAEVAAAFNNQLWVAAYQSSTPAAPSGWPELTFWQHTDSQAMPGVQGACDCSIYKP